MAYPERKIFGSENPAQTLLFIDDEDTVSSLGSTQLTCIRDTHALRNGQRRTRSQASDRPLGGLFR